MGKNLYIKVNEKDNVAIAVDKISAGVEIMNGIFTTEEIPQGHKIALCDIAKDSPIIRYGVELGYAINDIKKGAWINEHMLKLPTPPALDEMKFGVNIVTSLPKAPVRTLS